MMNFGLNSALLIQNFAACARSLAVRLVFLQAAIGFVVNGAFDEGSGEGGRNCRILVIIAGCILKRLVGQIRGEEKEI